MTLKRTLSVAAALALGLGAAGCVKNLSIEDAGRPGAQGGNGGSGGSLIGDIDQANPDAGAPVEPDGSGGHDHPSAGGAGPGRGGQGGGAGAPVASDAGTLPAPGRDGGGAPVPSAIRDLHVLIDALSAISVPAVGSAGVSLVQYTAAGTAFTLHVAWGGALTRLHETAQARYIYTAASGARGADLVYGTNSYGVYADGGARELSGTPASYKEFLAANAQGLVWVDYGIVKPHGGGVPVGAPTLGAVVFSTWDGARRDLTDALRYRARPDLSATHVVYVEYASTAAGSLGQIVAQPLAGGSPVTVSASPHHQDRPAVDGDWVVWEEYLSSTDAVIRARNLTTGETRDLSPSTGFRTNPDVLGTRVVWEDQRTGNGDLHYADLVGPGGDHVAISGKGHSTGARLTADGLVWIESNGGNTGLLQARWAP
jgi:beta propeller repeat protein